MSPRKRVRTAPSPPPPWAQHGLTQGQYAFALAYLENGFNASQAYKTAHPTARVSTCGTEGHHTLRNPKVRAFLNPQLEEAWKGLQMGGEQALARVALLAESDDQRVALAALRTILEQTGKLKTPGESFDALAAALRSDLERAGRIPKET